MPSPLVCGNAREWVHPGADPSHPRLDWPAAWPSRLRSARPLAAHDSARPRSTPIAPAPEEAARPRASASVPPQQQERPFSGRATQWYQYQSRSAVLPRAPAVCLNHPGAAPDPPRGAGLFLPRRAAPRASAAPASRSPRKTPGARPSGSHGMSVRASRFQPHRVESTNGIKNNKRFPLLLPPMTKELPDQPNTHQSKNDRN